MILQIVFGLHMSTTSLPFDNLHLRGCEVRESTVDENSYNARDMIGQEWLRDFLPERDECGKFKSIVR